MVTEVIIAHRDRLVRFGMELLEVLFETCGIKLVIDDQEGDAEHLGSTDGPQQLAEDLMAIVHVFSCREYGKRKYARKHQRGEGAIIVPGDQSHSDILPASAHEIVDDNDIR